MTPEWTDKYPSAEALRREVSAMVDTWVEVLLDRIPRSEIAGIYLKGSAQKNWDSPVDYVPELSDVDIHLLFRDSSCVGKWLTVENALEIQALVEDAYRKKISSPLHVPRPQLTLLNHLKEDPEYRPSPIQAVTTLYGDRYPEYEDEDEQRLRETARARMPSYTDVLATLPGTLIDKPGAYIISLLRSLNWRVSPIGPIVLLLRGMPWSQVWLLNRTQIIKLLEEHGEAALAADYSTYYLSAWDYFLSGYTDSAAARRAVTAAVQVLKRSREVASATELAP